MNIIESILKNAKRFPDKPAVIFGEDVLSYKDLVEQIRKVSYTFNRLGVGKGTFMGLLLTNSTEFVLSMLGAADLGASIVPMSSTLGQKDLLTAIKLTNIKYIIGWHVTIKNIFDLNEESFVIPYDHCITVGGKVEGCHFFDDLKSEDPEKYELNSHSIDGNTDFILTMTSGSTSEPKPIVFTQSTKIVRSLAAQELYGITEDDITLTPTPLYHSISQRLVLMPLITGGTTVIMKNFTAKGWFEMVELYKITFCIAVSAQLEMILNELENTKNDFSSMRCIVCCCALLRGDVKERLFNAFDCDVHECYGASEVGIISDLSCRRGASNKLHTVGVAVPGAEIEIVDNSGNKVPTGEIGEITCKSIACFSRYYDMEESTEKSFKRGYFYTGDMGYIDEENHLIFCSRKKEIIITGGTNIYPADVEVVLNQHPLVKEVSVVGVEDEKLGEKVVAFVILKEEGALTSRELQRHCVNNLADYQKPLEYVFVLEFPRTPLGKILKRKLIDQYNEGSVRL
jgi:long-chain acyl-CoA synthetase